jgi:hypothetical protein
MSTTKIATVVATLKLGRRNGRGVTNATQRGHGSADPARATTECRGQ